MNKELKNKIAKREIDVNNQSLFLSALVKGLLWKLNRDLSIRNIKIPHFFLNTGDDRMYLEVKGYDNSLEPLENTNEDYVYNTIPRCIVDMEGIEVLEDQLTNPYTRGCFDLETEDAVMGMNAEFRRLPLKLSVSLKYYLNSFVDVLDLTQKILTHLIFIQNYKFDYMGHTIFATYKVPTSIDHEKNISFDGGTTDSKYRSISLSLEIETNMPVFDERTVIVNDEIITGLGEGIYDREKDKIGTYAVE